MLKPRHLRHPLHTLRAAYDHFSSLLYDWSHGIRTTNIRPLATLHLTHPDHLPHAHPCTPSEPQDIRDVFRHLALDFSHYTFIDLGCGTGRVLAEAVRHPFRSVIGIDFARELCDAARANLHRTRPSHRCAHIQILHADATDFDFPPAPSILYLYNPFRGPVLSAVLDRFRQSVLLHPRHVRIAYVTPLFPEPFLQLPAIRLLHSSPRFILFDLTPPPPPTASR